ncbi:hypothetical protein BVG19_g975 [[Candida] boidinii]|nr:hypothetical protein BVG19_g975 [[Candida] boidinii]OWB50560.1 hypothetical protein B5S27_g2111 [[Candida] boidinii]
MSILPDSSPEVESPRLSVTANNLNANANGRNNGNHRVKASQIDPHTSLVASQPELRASVKQDKYQDRLQIHNDSHELNHRHNVSINSSLASIGLIPTLKTSADLSSSIGTDPLNLLKTTPKKLVNRSPERKHLIGNPTKKRKSKFELKNESDLLSIGNQGQTQKPNTDTNPNSSINNSSLKLNSSYDSQLLMNENTSLNNSYDNNTTPGTIIPLKAHTRDNSPLHKGTPIRKRNTKDDSGKIKKFTHNNTKKTNNKNIKIINKSQNIDFINSEMAKILSDNEYGNNKQRSNDNDVDNADDDDYDFNYDDFEDSVISPVVVTPKNYIRRQISGKILDYEKTQVKKDADLIHDTVGNNEEIMTSTVLRHGNRNTNVNVVDRDHKPIRNTQTMQEKEEVYDDEFESDDDDNNNNTNNNNNNNKLQNSDKNPPIDSIVHNDSHIVNEQDDIFRVSSHNFKESQILSSDDYNMKIRNQQIDDKLNASDFKDPQINTIDGQLVNSQEHTEHNDLVSTINSPDTKQSSPFGDDEDISFTISKVQDFIQMKRKQLKEDLREDYIPDVNKGQDFNKIDGTQPSDQVKQQNSKVIIQWNRKDWKKLLNYIRVFKITKNYKMLNIKKLKNEFKILNLNDFYLRMRILQKMILIKKLNKSYQKRDKFNSKSIKKTI